jgi:hypothetical protein
MAITVGALRDFCRINAALDKLYKEISWDRTMTEQKVTIVPKETLTDLVVTQGSLALASATGFSAKYLSGKWELSIDGYTRGTFELAAIAVGGLTATMRTGDEWTNASAAGKTCTFLNTRFSLPKVKKVHRVQVVESGVILRVMTPAEFDHLKQRDPGALGSDPRYCTWRRGFLEFWPHPGADYRKLSITYQREFTRILDTAADADEVDWDEEEQNVLEKAILVEAALTQGENSPVSYAMAKAELNEALASSKGFSQRASLTGPMGDPTRNKLADDRGWWWGEVIDA